VGLEERVAGQMRRVRSSEAIIRDGCDGLGWRDGCGLVLSNEVIRSVLG